MKCSVCSNEMNDKYCSKCGQYYINKRITGISIFGDFFNSIFSLEKSFLKNVKIRLLQPETVPLNYWNGFRSYYYSPGRFFTIASLFLVLHYLIANDFLGIVVSSTISSQFAILFFNIFLLTIISFLLYFKHKKNLYEHLILNIYNVSIWTILFVPLSMLLSLIIDNNNIEEFFFIPYHLLIMIWNSKAFKMKNLKRIIYVVLNFLLFYGTILLLIYRSGGF